MMSAERSKKRNATRLIIGALVIASLAFGLGRASMSTQTAAPTRESTGDAHEHASEWTCSMHPEIRRAEPGRCPICGMELVPVPVSAGDGDGPMTRITLSERARALARIRTSPVVTAGDAAGERHLLGRLRQDESTRRTVTAWIGGRIDRLEVRTTGERVRRGQVLASLYSPEVYGAHQDLLEARRQVERLGNAGPSIRAAAESALESSRQRLRLLGVPRAEVERMQTRSAPTRLTRIRSPFGGTVTARLAEEGSYVQTGAPLYRLADLTRLWLSLEAYEGDLSLLRVGQEVEFTVEAVPGRRFSGTVAFIAPFVDPERRTARVRVEVDNSEGALRPGLFAEARIDLGTPDEGRGGVAEGEEDEPLGPALFIPASSPLFTGRRSLVYVEVPGALDPTYEIRPIRLGERRGDVYPVLAGLAEGERVVTEGAFVLDADLQLRGGVGMMRWPDDREPIAFDSALTPPPRMRLGLAVLFDAYLQLGNALVEDDLQRVRETVSTLADAAQGVSEASVGQALERWEALSAELHPIVEALETAEDLPAARRSFHRLSDAMTSLLTLFGNPLDDSLHIDHCPMALDGGGGDWVQREGELENPYFGEAMLRCGSVIGTVPPGAHLVFPPGGEAATAAGEHRH